VGRASGLWVVGGLGLLAVLVSAPPAMAQVKIERVRLSLDENPANAPPEDKEMVAPSGTETLYVMIDYKGASRTKITTEVKAQGGLELFDKVITQTGDGTAVVQMTGALIFQKVAADLITTAKITVENADKAANEASGNLGYLTEAYNNISTLRLATDVLARVPLDGASKTAVEDLEVAVTALEELESRQSEVGTSLDRIKAAAVDVAEEAKLAQAAAEKLKAAGATITALPIPDTGADRSAPYDLMIRVGGSPALSKEFWVTSAAVAAPTATPTNTGSGAAGGTQGSATPRASGDRGTATRAAGGTGNNSGSGASGQDAAATPQARPTISGGAAERMTQAASSASTPVAASADGATPATTSEAAMAAETSTFEAAQTLSGSQAPASVPTWTVPAAAQAMLPDPDASSGGSGAEEATGSDAGASSGPNLAILGIGVMALIAVAVWLRRRM
jgi:hypothetical protein